jgi:hypothetical protein
MVTFPSQTGCEMHAYIRGNRDLIIDSIRGLAVLSFIVNHIEVFSAYSLVFWERVGVVTGAEGFVLLSGVVVGTTYKRSVMELGWRPAILKLLRRAAQLWRVNVVVIFVVALLSFLHFNVREVVAYIDHGDTGQVYPLYPEPDTPPVAWVVLALRLKIGPAQIQILGLYVCLLLLTPLALFLMSKRHTPAMLALSWLTYLCYQCHPIKVTGCMFEDAFPLMAWQLLYFNGQAVGYHRQAVLDFFRSPKGRVALGNVAVLGVAFWFWALNAPDVVIPRFARFNLIPPTLYSHVYGKFMLKSSLGILRVVDDFCVYTLLYALLARSWRSFDQMLGWLLVPLGQASLYVFIVHVFFIAFIGSVVQFGCEHPHFWFNTAIVSLTIILIWAMVRYRVLFAWIPR